MSYGARQALNGLSFSLSAGDVVGFLGPNGAGKTTTIRILTTILEPDSGEFWVDGISSREPQKIRRKIGVLPESQGYPKNITGVEYLTYFGRHYGQSARTARAHALELLEEVGLEKRGTSLIGSYSRGMRQRLGIARALVNHPVIVFLDEPTLGLDPQGQEELLLLIRRIARERNAGVVLCSHVLADIEVVCDNVIILKAGQIIATGSVEDVVGRSSSRVSHLSVPVPLMERARQVLAAMPEVVRAEDSAERDWLEVELEDPGPEASSETEVDQRTNQILGALIREGIPILSFEAKSSRLRDVFLELTEESAK